MVNNARSAGVVELVYTRDLSPRAARIEGSTPSARTIEALTLILIGKLPPASNARQCQAAKICGLVENACLNIKKQSNQSFEYAAMLESADKQA